MGEVLSVEVTSRRESAVRPRLHDARCGPVMATPERDQHLARQLGIVRELDELRNSRTP